MTKSPKSPSAPGKNNSSKNDSSKNEFSKNDSASKSDPTSKSDPAKDNSRKVEPNKPASGEKPSGAPGPAPAARPASVTPAVKKQDAGSEARPEIGEQEAAKVEPAKQDAPRSVPATARPVPAASSPAAPTAQPSTPVKRPTERSGPQHAQTAKPTDTRSQTSMTAMIAAGLVGGLIAGAGFIAYDLMMRTDATDQTARVTAVEERVEQLAQRETVAPDALGDVDTRLAAVETQASEALATAQEAAGRVIPEVPTDAIQANTEAVAALQSDASSSADAVAGLRSEVEALSPRIDTVAADLSTIQQAFTQEWRDAISQLGAANRLADAIAEGRPYAETYQALSALGVSADHLTAIEPFAQQGAPGPAELVAALREAIGEARAEQAAEAPQPPDVGGGFFQRLAERAITVEAVDEPAAPRPQLAPGVEAALLAGDFDAALANWEQQPEAVREATQNWAQTLRQRIAAAQAANAIGNEAIAALAAR